MSGGTPPIVVSLSIARTGSERDSVKAKALASVVARALRAQAGRGSRAVRFRIATPEGPVGIDAGEARFEADEAFRKAVRSIPGVDGIDA